MNTSEIFNPEQRKKRVVENFLNSQYGLKLSARGDAVEVHSMINKLIKENAIMATSVVNYENDSRYIKNTMLIEALKQILKEIGPVRTPRKINEQTGEDLAQAELILVAKNMVDKLQDMAEDVAGLQTDELMPLAEKIKVTFGQDQGQQFNDSADAALGALLEAIKTAKDALSGAVGVLSGETPAAAPMGDLEAGLEPVEPEAEDEFAAVDANSGEQGLPTGRELK